MGRWSVSFREDNERLTREESGDRPCARGEWCSAATRERAADGSTVRSPANGYQAFCHSCRMIIANCLNALPGTYARLGAAIGDHVTGEVMVRVPFGPSLEIRTDIDEIQRTVIDSVMAWLERVGTVAGLSDDTVPASADWRARSLGPNAAGLLDDYLKYLVAYLDALLALEKGPMLRPVMVAALGCGTPEAVDPVRCEGRSLSGTRCARDRHDTGAHMDERGRSWPLTWDTVLLLAGGPEAGNEVLRLDYIARAALLETNPDRDQLLGVQCENCGHRSLRRAAPPQHEGDQVYYAACDTCRALFTDEEYNLFVRRLVRFYSGRVTPAMLASAGLRGDETPAIMAAVA